MNNHTHVHLEVPAPAAGPFLQSSGLLSLEEGAVNGLPTPAQPHLTHIGTPGSVLSAQLTYRHLLIPSSSFHSVRSPGRASSQTPQFCLPTVTLGQNPQLQVPAHGARPAFVSGHLHILAYSTQLQAHIVMNAAVCPIP